ncbi:alpha/beta hydrolase family protein [Massilia horti]|uniref:S9 family peptidase n=1 Tax=Massilia horti TaxID=2562153 RepID=A0A4Y9T1M3_9BURK|nr:alpha/beta fold hydrolase [Massilia horti]TFW33258.1 S9 family peptidase [Massilia horti]
MQFPFRALSRKILLALALSPSGAVLAQAPAVPAPPPVEAFFGASAYGGAAISPSGRYLAVKSGAKGRHDFLVVIDLQTNTGKGVAEFNDADIGTFRWVNDERLVFDLHDKSVGQGNVRHAPGMFAVNRDGSQFVQLVDRYGSWVNSGTTGTRTARKLLPWNHYLLAQRGAQDSEYIYVANPEWTETERVRHVNLVRLNTLTGQTTKVPRPGSVQSWILDNKGEPRLAAGTEKDLTTIYYRDPANDIWRTLISYTPYSHGQDDIIPLGFGPDGTLYVIARAGGKDTSSVHTFNLATGKVNPEPLISTAGYDFVGGLITTRDKLLGVQFVTDAEADEWVDPEMKAIQATVDKLLPATVNLLAVAARSETPWVAVRSYADAIPPTYWLYNKDTKLISKVGDSRPAIDPKQMGRQQAIRYKARDGLDIPALLTLPPGGKRTGLPLVVMVHGGPWVRGASWSWHPETQFLATRGYAVLEPEFRGSTGFGAKHFLAGWKQWGLAMQNDVADGTRYLIDKGIVDPKRICIAGASYGGYATLMGLVNDPDLFKCGINWVGVTDINLMYNGSWTQESDLTDEWKQYGMPDMIGDQVKDAAQLKATSPIEQAARITQPVLLAYGGVDKRVPLYHGKKFYDAVTKANKNVEWIEYPEEGHGWRLAKNNIDFWTRVEKFLDKNIGKGAVQE